MLNRIEMADVRSLLPSGTVLWRPVDHLGLSPVFFTAGKKQDAICRVLPAGFKQNIAEPVINPYTGGNPQYGVVAIVPYEVPPQWVYMVVTGHDRAGRSVFARPYEADVEPYLAFRDSVAAEMNHDESEVEPRLRSLASHPYSVPNGVRRQLYFNRVERVFYAFCDNQPAPARNDVPR